MQLEALVSAQSKRILFDSGISLLLKLCGGLAGFGVTVIIGKMLGARSVGLFFTSLAIINIAACLSRLGLDHAITRLTAEASHSGNLQHTRLLHRTALSTVLLTSLSVALTVFTFAGVLADHFFDDGEMRSVLRVMCFATVGISVAWLHSHFFQGIGHVKKFQFFQNLGLMLFFTGILCCYVILSENPELEFILWSFTCSSVFIGVVSAYIWHKAVPMTSERLNSAECYKLFSIAWPLLGVSLLQQVTTWLPIIILGSYSEMSDVGRYSAAFRVATLTSLILAGVNSVVFPRFAALYRAGKNRELRQLVHFSTLIMCGASTPFLLLLLICPSFVLSWIGPDFTSASRTLQILTLGQAINVATGSVSGLLAMTGHQKDQLRCSLTSVVLLTILLILLVPRYGFVGAATAQTSALCVHMLLLTYKTRQRLGFTPIGL